MPVLRLSAEAEVSDIYSLFFDDPDSQERGYQRKASNLGSGLLLGFCVLRYALSRQRRA